MLGDTKKARVRVHERIKSCATTRLVLAHVPTPAALSGALEGGKVGPRKPVSGESRYSGEGARTMAADQHEALIRAYIDEVFNGHRMDALEKYWDDDLKSHWLGIETIHGLPAWRAAMEGLFTTFQDATYTLDDMFFAGDQGVWRGHWQATQQGGGQGIAASGRNVTWTVIIIGRFASSKLIEDWVELDRLGLFQQLGCIPTGS